MVSARQVKQFEAYMQTVPAYYVQVRPPPPLAGAERRQASLTAAWTVWRCPVHAACGST